MKKTTIIIIISAIVILLIAYLFYDGTQDNDIVYKIKEIHSNDLNTSIFIKQKVWGLTNDNQTIIISKSSTKKFSPDPATDYIYEGLSPFYYKFYHDTLFVYIMNKSEVPQSLKTEIKIVQTKLANPEMMRLIKDDQYKKEGLNTFE
jgi:hypothetical protein